VRGSIFALSAGGWILLQRRKYPSLDAAYRWIRTRTNTLARRQPEFRFRASAVTLSDWLTLEGVLADYETKRKAGDPEFTPDLAVRCPADSDALCTPRQGQFLAFIYNYTKLNGQPPAEADMERHFRVSPPAIHDMILLLEKKKLIAREPGVPRSIRVLVPSNQLPPLE
jgi:LexA DNA binding domain